MVRHITRIWAVPPNIVTEMFSDAACDLALMPKGMPRWTEDEAGKGSFVSKPRHDFINRLAIKARALAMVLAYPEIEEAVRELFIDSSAEVSVKCEFTGRNKWTNLNLHFTPNPTLTLPLPLPLILLLTAGSFIAGA